jgi:hypothetical protein
LPEIDGIDREDALTRIGEDRALMASLLSRVLREFAPLAEATGFTRCPCRAGWRSCTSSRAPPE